jgi:hypothetical protein
MKQIKVIEEVQGAVGLDSLLGEEVLLICSAYFYAGKLTGVNETFVQLDDPVIVYETGSWNSKGYSNAEKLHTKRFFVQRASIESYGVSK